MSSLIVIEDAPELKKVDDLVADLKALKTKYSFESEVNINNYIIIQADLDLAIERLSR